MKKNLISIFKKYHVYLKWAMILVIAIIAIFGFWEYINLSSNQPVSTHASQPALNLTVSPLTGTYPVGQPQTVTLLLKPADAGKTISSFNVKFTPNNLTIDSIGIPASFPGGDTSLFTPISAGKQNIAYVASFPSSKLPTAITIPITFEGEIATGSFTVKVVQATGSNIAGATYDVSKTSKNGQYTFTGVPSPTPSPAPTTKPH